MDIYPKQTLANATRFVTSELKEKEDQIVHAQEEKNRLEQELFTKLLLRIKEDYLICTVVLKLWQVLMYWFL